MQSKKTGNFPNVLILKFHCHLLLYLQLIYIHVGNMLDVQQNYNRPQYSEESSPTMQSVTHKMPSDFSCEVFRDTRDKASQ